MTTLWRPDEATTIGVAALDRAAGDRAGEAAKIEMRPVDPLHRQAERRAAPAVVLDLDALEMIEQIRPLDARASAG